MGRWTDKIFREKYDRLDKLKNNLFHVCGGGFLMSMIWAAVMGYSLGDFNIRIILIANAVLCGICYALYWFEYRRLSKPIIRMIEDELGLEKDKTQDPGDGPTQESS